MKKPLQLFILAAFTILVFMPNKAFAQIAYTANFNNGMNMWSSDVFYQTDEEPCMGTGALTANLYEWDPEAELISPSIGVSNGGLVTFNYRYKLINYDNFPDDATQNEDDWGTIRIYYGLSATGPWNLVQTVDPSNHIESLNCVTKTATFFPPAGSTVYMRVLAELENDALDYYVYFDQVQVTQGTLTACTGTPAASAAVASETSVCINENVTLSLNPVYASTGLNFQWQSSTDGVNFSNVPSGGTSSTYVAMQPVTTWYRATISCTQGGDPVTSAAVQVASTGELCFCDIDFADGVEPITLVNFAGINNTSSAEVDGSPSLEDFTALAPGVVIPGQTYPITLAGNTSDDGGFGEYENYFKVHIDFNHNGNLNDPGESFELGFIIFSNGEDGVQLTGNITIPANAVPGPARMRVVKHWYDEFSDYAEYVDPCGSANSGYGQAEDYVLNIQSTATPDFVNLQHPPTMTLNPGDSDTVYAQVWEGGVTEAAGAAAGITAWIGVSTTNTNPDTWTTWIPATYNIQAGNNDEYMATIGAGLDTGTYYYATRFQLNGGPFVYGGYTPTGGGYWDGITNISGVLTVNCGTEAPDAEDIQQVCSGTTLAGLEADGDQIIWYAAATGGSPLPESTELIDEQMYYAAVLPAGGCESVARTAVTVNLTVTDAPQVLLIGQVFCNGATIDEVQVGAQGEVIWYSSATGDVVLADDYQVTNMGTYYASQIIDGCESQDRAAVTVQVNTTAPPTGDTLQVVENTEPEELPFIPFSQLDIEVSEGATVTWYISLEDAQNGVNGMGEDDFFHGNGTYYVTQTIDGCESAPFAVTVDIILGSKGFSADTFKYYPNPVKDVFNISHISAISSVEVYNMTGQLVLANRFDANEAQVDMTELSAGTYIVKVASADSVKTVRIIKL